MGVKIACLGSLYILGVLIGGTATGISRKLIESMGEAVGKMADAGSEKVSSGWFDFEDNFLDYLLIFWIGWAVVTFFVVNGLLTFFGPLQPRLQGWGALERAKEGITGAASSVPHSTEGCLWLNSALNWFYLHYNDFPVFVDAWVKALNDQVQKLGGPVQIKFERVQSGSLPPKFSEVSSEISGSAKDSYVVHAKVDSRDLSFSVFGTQQAHDGVKLTNLKVSILKLRAYVRCKCYKEGNDMVVNVTFDGRPDIKVEVQPVNPYQDPADMVDIGVVEEVVRNAICLSSTTFNITHWATGCSENLYRPHQTAFTSGTAFEPAFEPIQAQQHQSAFSAPPAVSSVAGAPPKPPRTPGEKRLLVKVIKASGLSAAGAVDPCCIVKLDNPTQSEMTSISKNTNNPFWDEQFFFEVGAYTTHLKFEIIDGHKPAGENFLGEAIVYYEDLKRNPSSRQIIPLQGRMEDGEFVSGSITVEFLTLEPAEAELLETALSPMSYVNTQMSPKRMIEVTRTITPGGTVITESTTRTHRPQQYSRMDAAVDDGRSYGSHTAEPRSGIPTIESSPIDEQKTGSLPSDQRQSGPDKDKKKPSFASQLKKKFARGKKRSKSADRASSSFREGGTSYLQPPDPRYRAGPQSKDDIELVRTTKDESPNLKKSRSLGGSLKKLFQRSRRRSRSRGETSRESSFSRSSARNNASQGPSRENSIQRGAAQQEQSQQHQQATVS